MLHIIWPIHFLKTKYQWNPLIHMTYIYKIRPRVTHYSIPYLTHNKMPFPNKKTVTSFFLNWKQKNDKQKHPITSNWKKKNTRNFLKRTKSQTRRVTNKNVKIKCPAKGSKKRLTQNYGTKCKRNAKENATNKLSKEMWQDAKQ